MATVTSESGTPHGELRLADRDPEVTRSASGSDRFNVKFTLEGIDFLELQNVLTPRLAGVGVERMDRSGMTMMLYGIEQGREGEVLAEVEAAIDDVNRARKAAREDAEHQRSATEAADAVSEAQLQTVRDSFRSARQSA
jgi:hypothetical protein